MAIYKILAKICFVTVLFSVNCASTNKIRISNEKNRNFFSTDLYTISSDSSIGDYFVTLTDTTISNNGAYLFKGYSNNPIGSRYNDESGIHLNYKSNSNLKVIFFEFENNKHNYAGKVNVKKGDKNQIIKIKRLDLQKVFDPGLYKFIIVENDVAILRYYIYLIY